MVIEIFSGDPEFVTIQLDVDLSTNKSILDLIYDQHKPQNPQPVHANHIAVPVLLYMVARGHGKCLSTNYKPNSRWPQAEPLILRHLGIAELYHKSHVKGTWPEYEQLLKGIGTSSRLDRYYQNARSK